MKKFMSRLALTGLAAAVFAGSALEASEADRLFWHKDWKGLFALASGDLTPREFSLVAGGLWLQGRWADSLAVMDRIRDDYPGSVRPYGEMLRVLGLERTGKKKEAYDAALALYLSGPPEDLKYYVSYALSRLTGNPEEKRKWLRRMAAFTGDRNQAARALEGLMEFRDPSFSDAAALLKVRPGNSRALTVLKDAPPSAERSFRLGYGAYLAGRNKDAAAYLSEVPLTGPFSQTAMYHRAMVLYRTKNYGDALPLLTRLLFTEKGEFAERAAGKIGAIGEKGFRARAQEILYRASRELKGAGAAASSAAYAELLEGKKRKAEEDRILKVHAGSKAASGILWNRAWEQWKSGRYDRAFPLFLEGSRGRAKGLPEHLYWAGRCLEEMGELEKRDMIFQVLVKDHPFSVYSHMASPDWKPVFTREGGLARTETELERWGFAVHSEIIRSGSSDPAERYNGAWLARWLGREEDAYRAMRPLEPYLKTSGGLSLEMARYLYPRPFEKEVLKAAGYFGLDPNLIWAVMRQESAFNPGAVSSAGASGLMQLMKKTAQWEADTIGIKKYDIFSPSDNVTLGAAHLSRLTRTYDRLEYALAAYNAGGGSVNRWNREGEEKPRDLWIEAVPFRETRGYVKNVLANYKVYGWLYGAEALTPGCPDNAPEAQTPSAKAP